MNPKYRTWVEISRTALRHNLAVFQRHVGTGIGIIPVIKSNAYGHGSAEIVAIMKTQKYTGVGVAYGQEALDLRAMKYRGRIIVLSFWQPRELPELIQRKVELVVWNWKSLAAIIDASKHSIIKPNIHVKLDTGTSRIGFQANDIQRLRTILRHLNNVKVVGVFSHLANSEEQSTFRTKNQIKYFTTLQSGLAFPSGVVPHLACTASILRYPEARFGLVRLGIGLYGLWPSREIQTWARVNIPKFYLTPVLTWKTIIAQIKRVSKGTAVGYGGTWVAPRHSRIATIPIGYGDGYRRAWSNKSWVMIKGQRAPVIGRVSMNLAMVDATSIPTLNQNDIVTLLGPGVTADDLSGLDHGTINYEITTAIHPAIPRVIV